MIVRDDATESQVRAARPNMSTCVSANAGSGKTRVLTDRVARLLLAEVQPQHILCLTYTKAAASEMQNRLFKRLGHWAMAEDTQLAKELVELGYEGEIESDTLKRARTLFARAIETPGGLKIQTIHSFCASLLRRFPLEAGVSPLFKEMEDRAATLLREDIVEDMAGGPDGHIVDELARNFTGEGFEKLTSEIVRSRTAFGETKTFEQIATFLDLPADMTRSKLRKLVFLGNEAQTLESLIIALKSGSTNDQKAAVKLAEITEPSIEHLPLLESIFLTGKGAKEPFTAKLGGFPTKKVQAAFEDLMPAVESLMLRIEDARQHRLGLEAAHRAMALHAFAYAFLKRYENRKQALGWLDFDDLIMRARALLSDRAVAEWVLYRLDGGIDHILVDEAQDTSPVQWQVIERLAQEFTSGSGARGDIERTIFVVGDKKQSIYSFQGADPAEFDRMRNEFDARLEASGRPLQSRDLEYSFRSSDAILRLVDTCFEHKAAAGFTQELKHRAFNADLPGRVDLWPAIEQSGSPEEGDWFDPVDRVGETHHSVVLAKRIAREIKRMITDNYTIADQKGDDGIYGQRNVRAGDFLILVQRRSDLFHEIIRACKAEGLPIAGADRLKVGAEMAVRDLEALLSFLSTPEDSLSLAVTLRSPLFGWTEQEIYDLSHKRSTLLLWQALRDRREEFPQTMAILSDLMGKTDFLRPYDLIERILTRHAGRKNLLARLGSEAEDGINALLSQALSYERNSVPSLTGFLVWMSADELEIKRQMDSAGDRIRVMTVHGSKGLEAPIVIMPDTGHRVVQIRDQVLASDEVAVWNAASELSPIAIAQMREKIIEDQKAERLRLLYVAMTRAEKWLIVAAAGNLGKDGESWYHIVENGLKRVGGVEHQFAGGTGLRYSHGNWDGPLVDAATSEAPQIPDLPAYYLHSAPAPASKPEIISPSDLGGAKALSGDTGLEEEAAKARGRIIHLLLETLPSFPRDTWLDKATILIEASGEDDASDYNDAISEAVNVLSQPELSEVFAPSTLAEISLTAELQGSRIHGTIDRLIVDDSDVLIVDFKSNAVVPNTAMATPSGLLRQMGAYAHALKQIYPHHNIQTAILWTRTAKLMVLPQDIVTKALEEIAIA